MLEQPNIVTSARALPTGTVAFLFTDIEGSTQRWETHRDAMSHAIERHDALLQQAIATHEGYVFKRMGDAYCAVFRTAPQAIAAACDAQQALIEEDFSAVDGLKVRMAVHVGHADEHSGDYFGPTVNRVARLLAIGYGGQVLVSGAASDLSQGEMPPQTALRDLGSHRLKDLAQPEQVYQLVAPDLPQKFFTLRSLDALPNNLPLQLTSFIGRDEEIDSVKVLVDAHRLTTLVGTGGVGKTRLALQAGAELLERYEDGVWFIELAPLSDGTLILSELAPIFSVQGSGDRPLLEAVLAALRPKHALLIVDNCEHLVDPAAEIIDKILRGCPNIRILATSREALKISGETVHRVASLNEEAAVALFAERANAANDTFELAGDNKATIAKICRRLDGIALAIELAAARVRAVDVDELFTRLDERFRILTGGSRTALPRQQTMRALIDWSYDLLPPPEQALLRRVSVFAGGWTLDAASKVCADDEVQAWEILDQLTSLVDKSLVVSELNDAIVGGAKQRYRLLESTRQYAVEKLEASGERERLRRQHAHYFAALAKRSEDAWSTTPTRTWKPPLEAEIDNFRSALDWALTEKHDPELGGVLAGHLTRLWRETGMVPEGIRYVNAALAFEEPLSAQTAARLWLGLSDGALPDWVKMRDAALRAKELYTQLGDTSRVMQAQLKHGEALTRLEVPDEAVPELEEAAAFFAANGEERWANHALSVLSRNALWRGDIQLARDRCAQSLETARAQGDDRLISVSLNNLAEREFAIGNTDRAIEVARESLAFDRKRRDGYSICIELSNLAAYHISKGEIGEARDLAHEALKRAVDVQHTLIIVYGVQHLAAVLASRGDSEKAALLLGFTDSCFTSSPRENTERREYESVTKGLSEALGEARASELLQRGAAMRQDQAVLEALKV